MSAAIRCGFWDISQLRESAVAGRAKQGFVELVERVVTSPGTALFNALEAGVPTEMVDVIAGATSLPQATVLRMLGVARSTYNRRALSADPLPTLAGHRVMALLRLAAKMHQLASRGGDVREGEALARYQWFAAWLTRPMAHHGHKAPAELLRNHEGQLLLEHEIEQTWCALPAAPEVQDAFLLRARNAVERSIRGAGGISPRQLLRRMDDRIDAIAERGDVSKAKE